MAVEHDYATMLAMALTHRDRFRIKSQLSDAFAEDREWTRTRRSLAFGYGAYARHVAGREPGNDVSKKVR